MTDKEQQTMDRLGITHETKTIYFYQGYRYERLDDAIRFASRSNDQGAPKKNDHSE